MNDLNPPQRLVGIRKSTRLRLVALQTKAQGKAETGGDDASWYAGLAAGYESAAQVVEGAPGAAALHAAQVFCQGHCVAGQEAEPGGHASCVGCPLAKFTLEYEVDEEQLEQRRQEAQARGARAAMRALDQSGRTTFAAEAVPMRRGPGSMRPAREE